MSFAFLLFGALCGYAGYREARKFENEYGRSPWGLDPVGWGVVVFVTGLLLGAVLLAIARNRTKKEIARTPSFTPAPGAAPAPATVFAATAAGPVVTDPGNPYAPPTAAAPSYNGRHPGSMDILPS